MKKILVVAGILIGVAILFLIIMMVAFNKTEITYIPKQDQNSLVHTVKFGHANIFFIESAEGYILVDAGMPGNPEKLEAVFDEAGIDPSCVDLIIATHGHLDHIGLMAYAKEMTNANVLCHESLAESLIKGKGEEAVPQSGSGRFLNTMMSILEVFEGTKLDSVKADIPMTNFYDLCDYGVDGFVMHTPGHSEASVSIILDNGEAFIGDMIRGSGEGAFGPGMFYEDKEILVKSLENVSRWSPETIYLSHGGHISGDILNQTIESLRSGP